MHAGVQRLEPPSTAFSGHKSGAGAEVGLLKHELMPKWYTSETAGCHSDIMSLAQKIQISNPMSPIYQWKKISVDAKCEYTLRIERHCVT